MDSLRPRLVCSKRPLRTLSPASSSLTRAPESPSMQLCPPDHTHLTARPGRCSVHPGPQTPPDHLTANTIPLPGTLLTSILLTRGQALQTREYLMALTKNSPEKTSFKEEILNTLSCPGVPKATTCLLTDRFHSSTVRCYKHSYFTGKVTKVPKH